MLEWLEAQEERILAEGVEAYDRRVEANEMRRFGGAESATDDNVGVESVTESAMEETVVEAVPPPEQPDADCPPLPCHSAK